MKSALSTIFNWPEKDHWQALAAHIKAECPVMEGPVIVSAVFTVRPPADGLWNLGQPSIATLTEKFLEAILDAGVCRLCQVQTVKVCKVAPATERARVAGPKVWVSIAELGKVG